MSEKVAIIIGAGPAGLTAALELVRRSDIKPIILEKGEGVGGLARTINYKGNKMDIGPHRFFSKSDRVMDRWAEILPIQGGPNGGAQEISYHNKTRLVTAGASENSDAEGVMLLRQRQTRIFFLRRFFDYPITLSGDTISKLGLKRVARIGLSYIRSSIRPIRPEKNLEHFFINRFGRELYRTFFKSYTEKVWGLPCRQISAEWGAQRIKGLSILGTLKHIARKAIGRKAIGRGGVAQKQTESSLIEQFLYPKHGAGQMWDETARLVREGGGEILTGFDVQGIAVRDGRVVAIEATHGGETTRFAGDFFFSTMPVQEMVAALSPPAPAEVREVSEGLMYRDLIVVGLLLKRLKVRDGAGGPEMIKDNWIYIQEGDVKVGRLQICNNMSPALVATPGQVWISAEYFCYRSDEIWSCSDEAIIELATGELSRIGIIEARDVLDATVVREEKTYPAYFGSYERFDKIRGFVDGFENLFLIGRNGMHKYNNQDHSMLTAMVAVDNILAGVTDKENLWAVNTEDEYHEEKTAAKN
jgi:protoporphyrinogen oxidase